MVVCIFHYYLYKISSQCDEKRDESLLALSWGIRKNFTTKLAFQLSFYNEKKLKKKNYVEDEKHSTNKHIFGVCPGIKFCTARIHPTSLLWAFREEQMEGESRNVSLI